MFIFAIIVGILALVALTVGLVGRKGWFLLGGVLGVIATVLLAIGSSFYSQGVGEARVLTDWTGNIVGDAVTEPGAHWKEPWVEATEFDIRNQLAAFIGNGTDSYNGQAPNGPQITFQDGDGVTGNMDLVVLYSIKPDSVVDVYKQFKNQDGFRAKLIEQDIRSIPRDVAGRFSTIDLLTNRSEVTSKIQSALEARWADAGVIVDSVSLQEIRYPDSVKERFEQAQQARIDVETSKANLEKSKVDAEQKIVQAEAEAKANEALAKSLTGPILQQRYLDTLKELAKAGNLVITDGTSPNVMIQK